MPKGPGARSASLSLQGRPLAAVSLEERAHSPRLPPPGETQGSGGCDLSLLAPPRVTSSPCFCVRAHSPRPRSSLHPRPLLTSPSVRQGPGPLTLLRVRLGPSLGSPRLLVVQGGLVGPAGVLQGCPETAEATCLGFWGSQSLPTGAAVAEVTLPLAGRGPSHAPTPQPPGCLSPLTPHLSPLASGPQCGESPPGLEGCAHLARLPPCAALPGTHLFLASPSLCLPVLGVRHGVGASVSRAVINLLVLQLILPS